MAALLSTSNRKADLAVVTASPERTTQDAKAMGITGLVGAYETFYGGVANRIHNVQLVAHLIDDHYIAPHETFSFNATTGERSEEKGFLEAPVIINGELKTGLGGGVCQVSTTTFNAAYEAGLSITDRTNHALYISHYPLGRDATVNYPDTDLKFVNDTGHWLWIRTFVGSSSLTVALYGTPQHRKVESEVAPLEVTGSIPTKRVADSNMTVGSEVVEEAGAPPRSTHVRRRVLDADGNLMYDHTWYSTHVAEPRSSATGRSRRPSRLRRRHHPAPEEEPAAAPAPSTASDVPAARLEQGREPGESRGPGALLQAGQPPPGRGDRFRRLREALVELCRDFLRSEPHVDLEEALQAPRLEVARPREQLLAVAHERLRVEHRRVLEDRGRPRRAARRGGTAARRAGPVVRVRRDEEADVDAAAGRVLDAPDHPAVRDVGVDDVERLAGAVEQARDRVGDRPVAPRCVVQHDRGNVAGAQRPGTTPRSRPAPRPASASSRRTRAGTATTTGPVTRRNRSWKRPSSK